MNEQPQYQYPQMPYIEPQMQNSLKFQLEPDELIKNLRYILLGFEKVYNEQTGRDDWVKDKHSLPLINEKGMRVIESVLRGYLDKSLPMSDLEPEQIEQFTLGLEYDLRNMVTINFLGTNDWNIKDLSTASTIKNIVCTQVYATLRKAHLRGYQNFLKTIQRVTEVQAYRGNLNQYDEPQQSKSMGSRIPFIGKLFNR